MESKEFKNIDMVAKFSKFQVINRDFTRCRCNVFYTGRNRNYSDITKNALEKFISRKGYANIPVVAHLMKDDEGNYYIGGHDRKIIVSNRDMEIVDETVPFGVIPEDCNPSMDLITEKSGEQREYFSVDIILWTHRYPIMEASFGDEIYFNQSMEIIYDDYEYDGDYIVIKDFSMSALCLLNRSTSSKDNVEPCFESSVVKKFSVDESKFKQNFELMIQTLKQYEMSEQKGEIKMDKSKIIEKLSEFKFKNELGEDVDKYAIISVNDTFIGVMDRENYQAYSFDYAIVNEDLVIDTDSKKECIFTVIDKPETDEVGFSFKDEVDFAKKTARDECEASIIKTYTETYEGKLNEVVTTYEQLKSDYDIMKVEYEKYKADDENQKKNAHKKAVDELIEDYAKKIGRTSKFLVYRSKVDYSKSVEEIKKELTIMVGEVMMDKGNSKQFSYEPVAANCGAAKSTERYVAEDRYGSLLDKFKK